MSADPTRPLPGRWQAQGRAGPPAIIRGRRRKGPVSALITLLVIIVLLVVSDRAANAYAENRMASQFQSSLALSGKPHVTIQGFPFWTQLIARDFSNVDITATDETVNSVSAGGGALEIASLNAVLHGMHFHGTGSAIVDQFSATALITFTALGSFGGIPRGVTITPDGPDQVKATISLGPLSDSAVATVTQSGPASIHVHINDFGGIPADQLGSFADFTIHIPKLPAGVSIQSVGVTQQGLMLSITGRDTLLSQNS